MNKEKYSRLPTNRPVMALPGGGISANTLKLIAILLMISDHLWAAFMGYSFRWMTYLGRLAFPIFAFQIAEGFLHTGNFKKYALRLLVFAGISEIPFNLFYSGSVFDPFHQNVLFTLLLGLLALKVIDNIKKDRTAKNIALSVLWLVLILMASQFGFVDYGSLGMLTVVLFGLCRDFPFAWVGQLVGLVLLNIVWFEGEVISKELFGRVSDIPSQGFAVLALLPIWCYGEKKGRRSKCIQYGSYIFYPAHMLLLYLITYFAI